jgi:hypothetical protein
LNLRLIEHNRYKDKCLLLNNGLELIPPFRIRVHNPEHFMNFRAIEHNNKLEYYYLKPNDIVIKGDEFYRRSSNTWTTAKNPMPGLKAKEMSRVRRKI